MSGSALDVKPSIVPRASASGLNPEAIHPCPGRTADAAFGTAAGEIALFIIRPGNARRDTDVTHDLDDRPQLMRDDESRSPCSGALSNLRPRSPPAAHQFMLYYDI